MKVLAALVLGAVLLAGCGTVSASQAVRNWMSASAYDAGRATLVGDARSSERALTSASSTAATFHTVCSVLDTDTQAANSSLPTPDDQATALLSDAYDDLGNGANACYQADGDTAMRASALRFLHAGLIELSLGTLRLQAAGG